MAIRAWTRLSCEAWLRPRCSGRNWRLPEESERRRGKEEAKAVLRIT